MNCDKAKKWIPLAAGNDLRPRKEAAVRRHLEGCPECRKDADEVKKALRAAKAMAGAERAVDWSDAEWRRVLRAATASEIEKKRALAGFRLKPVLAGGLGVAFLIAGTLLLQKKDRAPLPTQAAFQTPSIQQMEPKTGPGQTDGTSKTIVSKETGLKIIWFYNKNFQGDGFGK